MGPTFHTKCKSIYEQRQGMRRDIDAWITAPTCSELKNEPDTSAKGDSDR